MKRLKRHKEAVRVYSPYGLYQETLALHIQNISTSASFCCAYGAALTRGSAFDEDDYITLEAASDLIGKPLIFSAIALQRIIIDAELKKEDNKFRFLKKIGDTQSQHGSYRVGLYMVDLGE